MILALILLVLFHHAVTVLGNLKAHVPGNPNALLKYEATSDQTLMVIENGTVLLNRPLDREVCSKSEGFFYDIQKRIDRNEDNFFTEINEGKI